MYAFSFVTWRATSPIFPVMIFPFEGKAPKLTVPISRRKEGCAKHPRFRRYVDLHFCFFLNSLVFIAAGYWAYGQAEGLSGEKSLPLVIPLVMGIAWGVSSDLNDPGRTGKPPVAVPGWLSLFIEVFFFGRGSGGGSALGTADVGLVDGCGSAAAVRADNSTSTLAFARIMNPNLEFPYPFIDKVLISSEEINERVRLLGEQITRDYADSEKLLLLGLLRGSVVFITDLMRTVRRPMTMDFMSVSSYSGTETSGWVRIDLDHKTSIAGWNVILVDDIVDSGITLYVSNAALSKKSHAACLPAPCRTTLRRKTEVPIDYLASPSPTIPWWVRA